MNLKSSLCVLAIFIAGCGGSNPGTLPNVPTGASEAVVATRDMLLDSAIMVMPLTKQQDLPAFESKFPKAVAAVKDKSIVIVWGKSFKEGIAKEAAQIIAYEANAATDGGWVIKEDGELYKLTAAEFAAQKPGK